MRTSIVLVAALTACSFTPPGQCLTTAECPQGTECTGGVCAGDGGGVVSGPDAGPNCDLVPFGVKPTDDWISVNGKAGTFGIVAYTIYGVSAGYSAGTGFQHFTSGAIAGSPKNISDTGLWVWNSTPLSTGQVLVGDNSNAHGYVPPYIDFRIAPSPSGPLTACPPDAGTGTVDFWLFEYPGDGGTSSGVRGSYHFQCPDAGIDVTGCFRYPKL